MIDATLPDNTLLGAESEGPRAELEQGKKALYDSSIDETSIV